MTEEERNRRIAQGREWIRWEDEEDFLSDQQLHRPQPPLFKEPMSGDIVPLPLDFENLPMEGDFRKILGKRKSSRVFTGKPLDLRTLSFLLWSAAGVRGIRGKQYATLRTVPSGGARHPFEMYVLLLQGEGVEKGLYHYQPKNHTLERLGHWDEEFSETVCRTVCGQKWVLKASALFYYSILPYRGEWRYAQDAHRVMMMDAGHTMENLYLSCSALGLGACAIGALDPGETNRLFGLDGVEEFGLCCVPVGSIDPANEEQEQSFYAFLQTEEAFYHPEGGEK